MHGNLFALILLLAMTAGMAAAADYPKIRPDRAELIERLPAGTDTGAVALPWRLHVPQATDGQLLPLVVFLHGAGRRGTDNVGPMELAWSFISPEAQAAHPCFVLAGQVAKAKRWVDHNWNKGSYRLADVPISDEMSLLIARVRTCIDEHPIDPERVYVVGQSMGGFGCWDAMLRAPGLWAAGIPICGGGSPDDAASIAHIGIWAWHGDKDNTIPVSASREMIAALQAAGAKPRYSEIAGGGHGVWNKAFADPELYSWLFAQRRSQP